MNAFGAAWTQIDEPKFRFSIRQNLLPNVSGFYYLRLHGRNAANWWRPAATEDRYNYLYSGDELREFSETANATRALVKKTYLYTNNHYSAKSVANAAMIKDQLGEPLDRHLLTGVRGAISRTRQPCESRTVPQADLNALH